jgi:hypothetical protein
MEIRIRGYFRGEIEADAEVAGTVESGQDVPTATNVRLLQELEGSSIQTTKHTAVTSPMTKSATHLCSNLYGTLSSLQRQMRATKRFNLEGFLLRDNQIAFWYL